VKKLTTVAVVMVFVASLAGDQKAAQDALANHIRGELEFLASDALQGRGSGTHDELLTAVYLGSELRQLGIEPGGTNGSYVQDASGEYKFGNSSKRWETRNVIGVLPGRSATMKNEVIMLSAHMDHLGIGEAVNGDSIYNGADDDASGCIAVLELARYLVRGQYPKRTVIFVFFGSEETGGQGNQYFLAHPPVALDKIVANLEFEMIGRSDPMVKPDELWLTGFELSNLGPELARHGAKLVADPHPERHFFRRSDNYALAKRGIIAHTVSSFGLHKDYHQPSDDLGHIDFEHLSQAVQSMIEPVIWLADSKFKPAWIKDYKVDK
jgi:Zn-dependent M28 family amino/carboxypeptidase